MTAIAIDLTAVNMGSAGIDGWAYKKDAAAVLAKLRERGRNAERCIEIHPAHNRFNLFWVIGRPDPASEFTWLMNADGSWIRGRLYDGWITQPATWEHMPTPEPIPATITHNYQYSAGTCGLADHNGKTLVSYGPDGRAVERTGWLASAYCIACTWSWNGSDETSARAAGRYHRDNPGNHPLKAVPNA